MRSICVPLNSRAYPIHIGVPEATELSLAVDKVCSGASSFILIADRNVLPIALKIRESLTGSGLTALVEIPSGEASKSVEQLERLWQQMALLRARPSSGDRRSRWGSRRRSGWFFGRVVEQGVRLLQVPTTLLSMVDSSVGENRNQPAAGQERHRRSGNRPWFGSTCDHSTRCPNANSKAAWPKSSSTA